MIKDSAKVSGVLDERQYKLLLEALTDSDEMYVVFERLLDCVFKPGPIAFGDSDLRIFLRSGKKGMIYKSATMKKATKEAVRESGLLCDELRHAHHYLISIKAGDNMTLGEVDRVASTFFAFSKDSDMILATIYDKRMTDEFRVDLFILK